MNNNTFRIQVLYDTLSKRSEKKLTIIRPTTYILFLREPIFEYYQQQTLQRQNIIILIIVLRLAFESRSSTSHYFTYCLANIPTFPQDLWIHESSTG